MKDKTKTTTTKRKIMFSKLRESSVFEHTLKKNKKNTTKLSPIKNRCREWERGMKVSCSVLCCGEKLKKKEFNFFFPSCF